MRRRKKKRRLPQPQFLNIHALLEELANTPRDENAMPKNIGALEGNINKALRADAAAWLAHLLEHFAKGAWKRKNKSAPHSRRATRILTLFGWLDVTEPYRPKQGSVLRAALGVEHKTTPATREAITRCGAFCGSFKEGRDMLGQLAAIAPSTTRVRAITLAAGAKEYEKSKKPPPDIRAYPQPPAGAATRVERTLVSMADGGSAPCCKADTQSVAGKNGEASTRQIRAALFAEYEWLDKDGHPLFYKDSFSYFVCHEDAAVFTSRLKLHGVSRGSGTVARMHCLADGEPALEDAFRDAFPHALFSNDFYHAGSHLHDCLAALLPDAAAAAKEYRLCRGLLYRHGAESVVNRLRRGHAAGLEATPEALVHLTYLEKRRANMRYGSLRKRGFLIGTGHMEAAIRVLIVRRCKQSGMHWRHHNAAHIAALHAKYRSQVSSRPSKAA